MFQKKLFLSLSISALVILASTGPGSANEDMRYPPMSGMNNTMPPPPAPAYNRGPRQNVPPQYSRPAQPPYRPQMGAYGRPGPYGAPAPYGRPGPYGAPAPYGGPAPYGAPMPYGARPGPWNNGGWNRGPGGGNRGFGNWFGGNQGPYGNNTPFGNMFGRRGIWGMHPDEWVTSNPEDGFSYMWDDMINAPSEMGEMPGGWNAPSISMPNPADVGSEFRREAPNLMREIPDMINVN